MKKWDPEFQEVAVIDSILNYRNLVIMSLISNRRLIIFFLNSWIIEKLLSFFVECYFICNCFVERKAYLRTQRQSAARSIYLATTTDTLLAPLQTPHWLDFRLAAPIRFVSCGLLHPTYNLACLIRKSYWILIKIIRLTTDRDKHEYQRLVFN